MRRMLLLASLLIFGINSPVAAASDSPDTNKAGPNKGLTFQEIGRGLKSAATNIGNEIPKIGPAIGDTFNKVTGKESEKERSQHTKRDKK